MKKVFEQYSNYYDKLYSTKDYSAECDYLEKIINQFSDNKNKNLLDLGCGTGGHSIILAKRGWNVTGIDRSDDMINIAKEKRNSVPIDFRVSDIRDFSSEKKFNVAISMFAVVSYLISNEDLLISLNLLKIL